MTTTLPTILRSAIPWILGGGIVVALLAIARHFTESFGPRRFP